MMMWRISWLETNGYRKMGMWNGFLIEDWNRYGLSYMTGLEISRFANHSEMTMMQEYCRSRHIPFGIHAPYLPSC